MTTSNLKLNCTYFVKEHDYTHRLRLSRKGEYIVVVLNSSSFVVFAKDVTKRGLMAAIANRRRYSTRITPAQYALMSGALVQLTALRKQLRTN